ncbi:MAG: hypothetical protein A3I38_01870 [Candidatus Wildermuthbacteria bacterium RIFCSPLOWO2_02_FULL_47_10]|uniref:Uncharacterized protein n=2 Tax=Candidatus Wildermuthiibacteriota TaxID=1817923 RepID=A0A1G2RSE7_9BACT|nr:MAG: hypothetical protein A3D59_00360 [Candidatus Wildermuthbacteria bacterium RIFCSPHIGHO2_02_FULL_47_17]OHA75202.1 MAG: hypothetical protein A3A32_02620 [Candidatus Wildermuthbacteria bacterium RIFCSPLOWO2_01_FULL_48_35]OHA75418.1 MAG: hypothetical protein A3I38_01870 [Candidatus Wildermuthbacteria bacterium RIFCSPLOWO2_02_FULL_47_10]
MSGNFLDTPFFLNLKEREFAAKNLKLLMFSASPFVLPARPIRAAQSAARTEFRSSYFKNTPPRQFGIE